MPSTTHKHTTVRQPRIYASSRRPAGRATTIAWRAALPLMALLASSASKPVHADGANYFSLKDVVQSARQLAARPYVDNRNKVPEFLKKLTYDQYRDIRFRADKALWAATNLPFQVQFFHVGAYYQHPVTIHVLDGGTEHDVAFASDMFAYGKNKFPEPVPADAGFAGFRIHYPIKTHKYFDEVAVFLGASYFRAIGRDQVYGLSARGVAVDTALPQGEQFPYFKEFWLVKPTPGARRIRVYALLDGKSLTGAYQFDIEPGKTTSTRVKAVLIPRHKIEKLGLAPLTSMFLYGEGPSRIAKDYRPEVHDSDGLLIASATGEWIWRPLVNPSRLLVSSFSVASPQGFGLLQRDRDFDHYQDLETRSELRPGAWIVPQGDWGAGRVELVEIPSDAEKHDNVVAYWVPEIQPSPEKPLRISYEVQWISHDPSPADSARALSTRVSAGNIKGTKQFVIDFGGRKLDALPAQAPVRGEIQILTGGTMVEQHTVKNAVTGGWRLSFQVKPTGDAPIDVNAYLVSDDQPLTETWSYLNDDR